VYENLAVTVDDHPTGNPLTIDIANSEFGSSSRIIALDALTPTSGAQTQVDVTYFAQEALPNYGGGNGYQVSVYYRTQAPQTAGVKEGVITDILPVSVQVEPLAIGEKVWVFANSVGSLDLPYPYLNPSDKIPAKPSGSTPEEWFFCASSEIALDNFNTNTGTLTLPTLVPLDVSNNIVIGALASPPDKDEEFRAYYPVVNDLGYQPLTASQSLTGASRHKNVVPLLVRSLDDTPLFRKNEILLVLFTNWQALSTSNVISFDATGNTSASIFRTKNLLLMVG
jgi:hypothetical protein